MLRRVIIMVLALMTALSAALAEAPYCVVAGGVAVLADADGNALIPPGSCEDIFPVVEGSLYAAGETGSYALVDAEGRPLTDQRYGMFSAAGDMIVFRRGWHYGAMDRRGSVCVDPVWTQLTRDGRGGWLALAGNAIDENVDGLFHLDANGNAEETGVSVLGLLRGVCGDRMACCGADGLWGYVDGLGREAIPYQWRAAGDFQDGRAIVAGEDGCGVIDADGQAIIEPEYAFIARVGDRFAALDGTGSVALFDAETGAFQRSVGEGVAGMAVSGGAMILFGDETRLVDAEGTELCSLSAEGTFSEGADGQFIATDGEWGAEASWIVNPDGAQATGKYQRLLRLCADRYAFVTMKGETYRSDALNETRMRMDYDTPRYGMIDGAGRTCLPAEYRMIRALDDRRLLLMTDAEVCLADRDGAVIASWPVPESGAASDEAGE